MRASVVVPTYRRPELLARCLAALLRQTMPSSEYEIIVADDGDSPDTRRQVEAIASEAGQAVVYVPVQGVHGPAAARNRGWQTARGRVIAFTDDDTIPDPGWLEAGVRAFEADEELAAITGKVVVPLPDRPTDYERNESGLARAEFVTANCLCRRAALEEIGGFDERFRTAWREDSDLHFNLLEHGKKIGNVPEAVVVHPVRPAPWGISLRQQRKVVYDALLFKKHPVLFRRHIRSRAPWRYYLMVATLLLTLIALLAGQLEYALASLGLWAILTLLFCLQRLRGNSWSPRHVAEMAVTSALIPPLSLFWRLYGAARFRVVFW